MIKIFDNKDQLSAFFGKMLIDGISNLEEGEYYSIALSGGSTPRAVFEYLAENYKEKIAWDRLIVFWGDERCVPPKSKESNYKMANESLLHHVPIPEQNIYRILGENDPIEESKRYADLIIEKVGSQSSAVQFDLIMLGLGTDGHTASIFPDSQHLFASDELCAVVEHPESKQKRITITGKVINTAKSVVFLVTGDAKADKVSAIVEKQKGSEKFPASEVKPTQGDLVWLLDKKAASKLKKQ